MSLDDVTARALHDALVVMEEQSQRIADLEGSLSSLLDWADKHRVTWPNHDHDCYELWSIEKEFAQRLLGRR